MNESVITPAEVAALNAARTALEAIAVRNHGTLVQGTALVAGSAVFAVLNHANAYLAGELTLAELHNER